MRSQFRKLDFESPETIDRLFTSSDFNIALTDKEGGMRVYKHNEESEESYLITSYQDHKGPIMDVAFSSVSHPFYILTCSYDRSISLRSRENQMFSYKEEDATTGFFVCCTFVNTEANTLRFLVGSSNGYVLDFDSRNSFEPKRHSLLSDSIIAIGTIDDSCIMVCGGSMIKVYTDSNFHEFVDINIDTSTGKLKVAKITGDALEARLLIANENNRVRVMRLDRSDQSAHQETEIKLDQKILSASWNFSRCSATLLIQDADSDSSQVKILKEDLANPGNWNIVAASSDTLNN